MSLTDRCPPDGALALLTGDDAADLLSAAVGTAGGTLVDWRPQHVDHRPGKRTTVSYSATVRWPDAERIETLGAWARPVRDDGSDAQLAAAQPGVLLLSDGDHVACVWQFPHDPDLPGLAKANDPVVLAGLLSDVGVRNLSADGADIGVSVRAYRPRRRAVLEVQAPSGRLFLKVRKPSGIRALHERHRLLRDAGLPVPRSLGWSDDGILVLEPLLGRPMRPALIAGEPVPTGEQLAALIGRLPDDVLELPHRSSWTDAADHYAGIIASVLPDTAEQVHSLAERILGGTENQPPTEPCHGDLYEAQLLVGEDGGVTGLVDIDTAGPGRRADDFACAIAHAHVLTLVYPEQADHLESVAADWLAVADTVVDPEELRWRIAGVLLSLATGPHRVQDPHWPAATRRRLAQVEYWAASAEACR